MLLALVLTSALLQGSIPRPSTLRTKVVDAIDHNYLYAEGDSWQRQRAGLLADANTTVSALDQQLSTLHDGDLRIITSKQMAAMQQKPQARSEVSGW